MQWPQPGYYTKINISKACGLKGTRNPIEDILGGRHRAGAQVLRREAGLSALWEVCDGLGRDGGDKGSEDGKRETHFEYTSLVGLLGLSCFSFVKSREDVWGQRKTHESLLGAYRRSFYTLTLALVRRCGGNREMTKCRQPPTHRNLTPPRRQLSRHSHAAGSDVPAVNVPPLMSTLPTRRSTTDVSPISLQCQCHACYSGGQKLTPLLVQYMLVQLDRRRANCQCAK